MPVLHIVSVENVNSTCHFLLTVGADLETVNTFLETHFTATEMTARQHRRHSRASLAKEAERLAKIALGLKKLVALIENLSDDVLICSLLLFLCFSFQDEGFHELRECETHTLHRRESL